MIRTALLLCLGAALLEGAAPHYFITTYGGFTPPYSNPVAKQRYFTGMGAIAYDHNGNLYWAVFNGYSVDIRRLNADGTDTQIGPGLNKLSTSLSIDSVNGMMIDAQNNLYVGVNATYTSGIIYYTEGYIFKVTPAGDTSLVVTESVGTGALGFDCFTMDSAGNIYTLEPNAPVNLHGAQFYDSLVMYPAAGGGAYQVLVSGQQLGQVSSAVVVNSTLYFYTFPNQTVLMQSNLQGTSISAAYTSPTKTAGTLSATPAADGTVFFAENYIIRQFLNGGVQPVAGTGVQGSAGDGGPANVANFGTMLLTVNPVNKDVAFYDYISGTIRVVSASAHTIQTVAGTAHFIGDSGPVILAHVQNGGMAADGAGNLYVLESNSARIRKINPQGVITTIAGNGIAVTAGDGGKAVQASIAAAGNGQLAVDKSGNVYFVGTDSRVRKIDTGGTITTIAGGGTAALGNASPATSVSLVSGSDSPACLAADASGNVYIGIGRKIWKVDSGLRLSSFAGTGASGSPTDGSAATTSPIGKPISLALDTAGNLYFGDYDNFVVRKIDTHGSLTLVAGAPSNTEPCCAVPNGPAKAFNIPPPYLISIDAAGNLYTSDNGNNVAAQILMVDPTGNLTRIAGPGQGPSSFGNPSAGNGGDALLANFDFPSGMAVDASGNIYVLDGTLVTGGDAVIRKLSVFNPTAPPPFVGQGGVVSAAGSIPAVGWVSDNGIATLFGANFIAAPHSLQSSDLVNGQLPTNMVGVCTSFGGKPAAMLGVYPNQINVQAPSLPPGPVIAQVTLNCGTASAVNSNLAGVMIQPASPEFFSFLPDPVKGNPIAAYNATTGVAIGPQGLLPGVSLTAAHAGDIVEAYGTGWGVTNPPFGTGVIPGGAAMLASNFSLTFGNVPVPAANIAYLGVSPCCAGLYQVDFTVPDGVSNGNQPLVLNVAGWTSPSTAYLTVQQ